MSYDGPTQLYVNGEWTDAESGETNETVDPATDWFLTFPFNFGGPPALSVPAGATDAGLPVGLQVAGQRFADDLVLAAGAALERARPWAHLYEWL